VSGQRKVGKWAVLACALALACEPSHKGQSGDSQTNWLRSCQIDSQCPSLSCVCGICTTTCKTDTACEARGASCIQPEEPGAIAQCGGSPAPGSGFCMERCDEGSCDPDHLCVSGVCTPLAPPTADVTVDIGKMHQVLVGFGASMVYGEDQVTEHPQRAQLLDAAFVDMGIDVLRLRNRYVDTVDVSKSGELVAAVTSSLGHAPTIFLTSWTPPVTLKANSSLTCMGNAGCTLAKTADGAFDYQGFGQYWRASLDAYAKVGVRPDYIGIQNNPNWIPNDAQVYEACRFLPTQGNATAMIGGQNVTVDYPGLAEAQTAVVEALVGLSPRPKLLAPETSGSGMVVDYVAALDLTDVDAFAHHLFGSDPAAPGGLAGLDALPSEAQRPVFITEMQADGFGTALALHHATVDESAAVFLQNALTGSPSGPAANTQALLGVDDTSFLPQEPYHAFRHFARSTAPGWVRVDAVSNVKDLLASAWVSPNQDALTVVLINAGSSELSIKLALPQIASASSQVTRTAFSGVERSAPLGEYSASRVLQLPTRAVMTIALEAP
jgi:hypothetical protein